VTITITAPAAPALDPGTPGLRAELDAVEQGYPGWYLHLSEAGIIWCDFVSGAPSLRALTPLHARRLIAEWEHLMDVRYGPGRESTCAQPGCTHDHGSHWDGTGQCGFCGCGTFQVQDAA
jgi:hypothetical protein